MNPETELQSLLSKLRDQPLSENELGLFLLLQQDNNVDDIVRTCAGIARYVAATADLLRCMKAGEHVSLPMEKKNELVSRVFNDLGEILSARSEELHQELYHESK